MSDEERRREVARLASLRDEAVAARADRDAALAEALSEKHRLEAVVRALRTLPGVTSITLGYVAGLVTVTMDAKPETREYLAGEFEKRVKEQDGTIHVIKEQRAMAQNEVIEADTKLAAIIGVPATVEEAAPSGAPAIAGFCRYCDEPLQAREEGLVDMVGDTACGVSVGSHAL